MSAADYDGGGGGGGGGMVQTVGWGHNTLGLQLSRSRAKELSHK